MKHVLSRFAVILLLAMCGYGTLTAQIVSDTLTIKQIQEVSQEDLDLGITASPHEGDTVTVTGVVYAAPRQSPGGPPTFALGNAFTMYIMMPEGGAWSGLNVRASDSASADAILINAVDTAYVVRLTGVVTQYYSTTQFEIGIGNGWNADMQVEVLDVLAERPAPTNIDIDELVLGGPSDGIPSGQQYEGVYVVIEGAKVGSVNKNTSSGRYTWTLVDGSGNSIGVYDQSVYFRGGSQGIDPDWAPPAPGTTISAIRGVITSSSQGVVIAPLYPGDIQLGSFPPIVSELGRSHAIPTSGDDVTVTCKVTDSNPDGSITDVTLVYGTNDGNKDTELGRITMTYDGTTTDATGMIPAQGDGDIVWYYIEATDDDNETVVFPGDILSGKPFYLVRDGALSISDIQYTPYTNGVSGAVGGEVTVRGTVVGGSLDLGMIFIQDGTAPWSGVMVRGDENIRALETGMDVTVTGTVEERFDVTSISDAAVMTDHGTATLPAPVELTTGIFETDEVTNGDPDAEQWEGMLTVFKNLAITSSNADEGAGNYGEILVNDNSGDMRVDDVGTWKDVYTNDPTQTDKIFLGPGMTIESLTGISYYSFGNYKLEPRGADDFVNVGEAITPPEISDVERNVAIPSSSDDVTVTCTVVDVNEGGSVSSVEIVYGLEGSSTESGRVAMSYDSGTMTATGAVPAMADGDVVWYYILAKDNEDTPATYPEELDGPRPFFIVRDGDIRIRDIQYTPYDDGMPGANGFEGITTRGIVTFSNRSTHMIQDSEEPWSGIVVYASGLSLEVGDDISVTGKINERYGLTQLSDLVVDENHGKVELPAPIAMTTDIFENEVVTNGDRGAEPYEAMLLVFSDLTVTASNADEGDGNFGEILVSDDQASMRVDDAGTWGDVYTNDPTETDKIFLAAGTMIQSLTGVMHYSFDNWKLQPRDEDDFQGVVTSIDFVPSSPAGFVLHQNYPNPFTASAATTITFDLPRAADVTVTVFDALGRQVAVPVSGTYERGTYHVGFSGNGLPAGMYLYRISAYGTALSGTMVITR